MKTKLISILLIIVGWNICYAQNTRYDDKIFLSVTTSENVTYANAPQLNSPYLDESNTTNTFLAMDIHQPTGDTYTNRRAIIFVHGGAFVSGDKDHDDMKAFCDSFALKGYVTATINYRLGMNSNDNASCTRAVYRALQDGRSAVRFLRANAATYGIDPSRVYMAGSSAGGFIALFSVYMDDVAEKPAEAGAYTYYNPGPVYAPDLGGYDIGNHLAYSGLPDAILSLWGAVKHTDLITVDDDTPVFLIHGTADNIVPFNVGSPFNYFNFPPTYGSNPINSKLNTLGFTDKETYFVVGEGHEFYGVNNGTWTNGIGGNAYWDTVVAKTTVFFANQGRATVTTTAISNICYPSATSGGNVNDVGNSPVTAKGVCWNTSTKPTINNSYTSNGTGAGSFVSALTGLDRNSKYYVRAYATNTDGTAYGEELVFFTKYDSPGYALSFDGINEYVTIPDHNDLDLTSNYTIEVWIKPSVFVSGAGIISKYQGTGSYAYFLSLNNTSPFTGINFDGLTSQNGLLSAGTWTHIAAVNNNGTRTLYVNGIVQNLSGTAVSVIATSQDLCIARHNGISYMNTSIDDIRIWSTARSQSEIRDNMHRAFIGKETGLVAYWPFNDGTGSAILSDPTSGLHGSLENMEEASDWLNSEAIYKKWQTLGTSSWSTGGNWSTTFSPPTSNDMVLISPGTTQAHITNDAEAPAVCDILKIESTAILTLNAGKALTVSDNIQNEAGTSGLVLKSIESGTASLIHETTDVDATVERYIPKYVGESGWHYLSSPVALQEIQPGFVADPPNSSDDFFKFSEPDYLWLSTKDNSGNWESTFEDNFVVGRGYNVAYEENETKSFAGELNVGDFTFNGSSNPAITYTADGGIGWNLMGNPYPSGLAWDSCLRTNIDASVYAYDGDAGQYVSWNGSIGALYGGIIPPMNAFFIKASANPELTIPNSARAHAANNFYKEKEYVEDLLVLKVEGNGFSDQTYLHFDGDASNEFDSDFDAYKLSGISEAPQLYTKSGDSKLSINVLPFTSDEIIIPLGLKVGNETEYKISVTENTFWETVDISLKDLESGILYDLRTQTSITLNHSLNNSPDRFLILINGATGVEEISIEDDGIEIYSYGNQIFVKTDGEREAQVTVYNLLGQTVLSRTLTGLGILSGFNPARAGFYLVVVRTDKSMKVKKVFVR